MTKILSVSIPDEQYKFLKRHGTLSASGILQAGISHWIEILEEKEGKEMSREKRSRDGEA